MEDAVLLLNRAGRTDPCRRTVPKGDGTTLLLI